MPEERQNCERWTSQYTECRPEGPIPMEGLLSFDNIGRAGIVVFQVISMEEWTTIMYTLQDAYSFWVWIYFTSLILIGAHFAVNLCLVVIATQFSATKKREIAKMRRDRKMQGQSSSNSINISTTLEESSLYFQLFSIIATLCGKLKQSCTRLIRRKDKKKAAVVGIKMNGKFLLGYNSLNSCMLRYSRCKNILNYMLDYYKLFERYGEVTFMAIFGAGFLKLRLQEFLRYSGSVVILSIPNLPIPKLLGGVIPLEKSG